MEFLISYCSSSDDSDANEQKDEPTKVDYFGLDDSESENEYNNMKKNEAKLQKESLILSEKSYGPELKINCDFRKEGYFIGEQIKRRINEQETFEKRFKISSNAEKQCCEALPDLRNELSNCSAGSKYIFNHSYPESIIKTLHCRLPSKKVISFKGHDKCITSLHWASPRYGHLYLTSSLDNTVKIWDHNLGKCVFNIKEDASVKAAVWTNCGTRVVSGGYSKRANIFNLISGTYELVCPHDDYVSSVQVHPNMDNIILTGLKNGILVWDAREKESKPIRSFTSKCGQVLDIAFINEAREILCSSDIVSRDSADRTIIAWEFQSGALLSNQIFQERYTCPCLREEPGGKNFIAQTNGGYIAIFSSHRPYKLNKWKRYQGHKVAGYHIGCDFSPDGTFITSGDAEGGLYFYKTFNTELVKQMKLENDSPITNVSWHPFLTSTVVAAAYNGTIHVTQ